MKPEELADSVVSIVKSYVAEALKPLQQELAALNLSIKSVADNHGKIFDSHDSDIKKILADIKEISEKEPIKGEPGKDAVIDMAAIEEIIKSEVSKIPAPKDGENGKDADMEQIKSYINEQLTECVKSIPTPQDGKSITVEDVKPLIFDYIERQIEKLPKAEDGLDGLDALDIEILPAINPDKAYPRGVYATHNGGLWKSHKNTEGMNGWDCIVNGVSDIEVNYDGERDFSIKTIRANGEEITKGFKIPIVIDKGVFRDGQNYVQNDGVTFAGSFWIAKKDMPKDKPGSSDDWRLAVKRGRDGRESVKVERESDGVKTNVG